MNNYPETTPDPKALDFIELMSKKESAFGSLYVGFYGMTMPMQPITEFSLNFVECVLALDEARRKFGVEQLVHVEAIRRVPSVEDHVDFIFGRLEEEAAKVVATRLTTTSQDEWEQMLQDRSRSA